MWPTMPLISTSFPYSAVVQAPVQGHFAGTAEPLLGYPHFQGHHALTAQALIPVGHW